MLDENTPNEKTVGTAIPAVFAFSKVNSIPKKKKLQLLGRDPPESAAHLPVDPPFCVAPKPLEIGF